MISRIDVHNTSSFQILPLKTLQAYAGSRSALEIINLPDLIGVWKIKGLKVVITYPDNSQSTLQAKKVKDSYVVSIPSCDMTGKVSNGFQIMATAEDESGDIQADFVLGVGDVEILSRDTIGVGESVKYILKYTSDISSPSIGDVSYFDGDYKMWDGNDWVGNTRLPKSVKIYDSDIDVLNWNITIKGGEITLDSHIDSLSSTTTQAENFTI